MIRSPRRFVPHLIISFIVLLCAGAAAAGAFVTPLPNGEDEYNSPKFVVTHAWMKFGYLAAEPFRDDLSRAEEDTRVARFLELTGLIAEAERVAGDPATPPEKASRARRDADAWLDERGAIENSVEKILEGRLTELAEDIGLTRDYGVELVWPPVDIEFEETPSVLVTSPRSEIRKESERLLQGDLPVERVQEIERRAESDGQTSALVVRIGGIAMYPALIPPSDSYLSVLRDMAHEWMHHYLYFTPLGRRYYANDELRTLNETLANLAGEELGDMLGQLYPLPEKQARADGGSERAAPDPAVDFTVEMRTLRRDVEAMLAEGRVEEAERLMEEKRAYLAEHGYYIRRLNQAYFAFHGAYADTPASIDPIGPKLEMLRERSGSVEVFVRAAQALRSEADLDRALGE